MLDLDVLLLGSEEPFAVGASVYKDGYPGLPEPHPRIYMEFRPEGTAEFGFSFLALLDTGGHYCILNEEVASLVQDHLTDHLGSTRLRTAHGPVQGNLYLLKIELLAHFGDNLEFEVVTFIAPEWQAPSVIGYTGVLDRVRFAISPRLNRIYVGLDSP